MSASAPNLLAPLLRRPFVSIAAFFILGVFAHPHIPQRPTLHLAIIAAALLLALLRLRWLQATLLALCFFLSGAAMAQLEASWFPANHVGQFLDEQPRLVWLEMVITQPPRVLTNRFSSRPQPPRQVTQAKVVRILTTDGWKPAAGQILLQIAEPHPQLAINQRIQSLGLLSRPLPPSNPGQFDWSHYYREQRILASFHIPHFQNIHILASPGPTPLDRLRAGARNLLELGFYPNQSLDHALLRALVLGDTDPQLRDIQDQFIRTGTSHHLAISGTHIAVLGVLVYGLCRLLFLPPRLSTIIGLVSVIAYGTVALPSPPVLRSVILCCTFAVGMLGWRSMDGVQLLALSVFLMLIYHPQDLYGAGFQLSFGTVLGMMLFTRPANAFLQSLRDPDVVIAQLAKPLIPNWWQRILNALKHWALQAIVVGVIAWLVAAPLVAFHFNQINPWALFAGILLAVPVFWALIAGLAKIVLTFLYPSFAPALASIAAWAVFAMRWSVDHLAMIPGSNAPMPAPPLWLLGLYYLLLCLFLLPQNADGAPRRRRFVPLLCPIAAIASFALFCLLPTSHPPAAPTKLTLLSVGAGQCAVVQLASRQTILIDAGSASISDPAQTCLIPFLKFINAPAVDQVFISHANEDHFNAVDDLARQYPVRKVLLSPAFPAHAQSVQPAANLLATLSQLHLPPTFIHADQTLQLDPQTTLEVLWPPADCADLDANNSSLVLKLTINGRSILFTGDIQKSAHEALLARPEQLKADVLVAPHHGSNELTTEPLLLAIDPRLILCSNSQTLSRKQREFDRIAQPRTIYRTSRCGAITLSISPDGQMQVETFFKKGE